MWAILELNKSIVVVVDFQSRPTFSYGYTLDKKYMYREVITPIHKVAKLFYRHESLFGMPYRNIQVFRPVYIDGSGVSESHANLRGREVIPYWNSFHKENVNEVYRPAPVHYCTNFTSTAIVKLFTCHKVTLPTVTYLRSDEGRSRLNWLIIHPLSFFN
ncbi:hypothetical protein RF11_04783 [Thelohanellus kitauei]|uniref:Uncharacterized protein n=1 Tax=Thelohanellus kitauei TaxID=669202 RepID=A0A0C2MLL7_THEKT|nr:hypothetical protein RF11_04783 [Thelohanellus kitauei]